MPFDSRSPLDKLGVTLSSVDGSGHPELRRGVKAKFLFGIAVVVCLAWVFVFAPRLDAQSSSIRILASNGVRALLEDLRPQSEKVVKHQLAMQFGTSVSMKQLIAKGESFDLAIMTAEAVDDLIKDGSVTASSRAIIGRVGIGVGIRSGTPRPDIKTAEAMKRTVLNARAISYAGDGASRPYIVKMLETLGIADQMKPKTILEQGSVRAAERVVAGDAELLITLISEILPVHGMELVGPLPSQFQSYVSFAAGASAKSANADAAKALIAYLSGPGVAATLKAKGIDKP